MSCGFTKQKSVTYFAGFSVLSVFVTAAEHCAHVFVLLVTMAKLLLLVAVANSVTTAVHVASVVVLSMDVTLHCGTKAEEIHGTVLQRFPVGSSLNTLKNFAPLVRLIAFVFTFTSRL